MANKIGRIVLGIVIIAALLVGIYYILPGQYKNPLTASIQSATNNNYSVIVDKVKASTIPKHKGVTYDSALNAKTRNLAWTIKKVNVDDAGDGLYDVYADGYKCTVTFENEATSDSMITQTNAHVRIVFQIQKKGSVLTINSKEIEKGSKCVPTEIHVNETVYKTTDDNNYFQACLDFFAGE